MLPEKDKYTIRTPFHVTQGIQNVFLFHSHKEETQAARQLNLGCKPN